MQLINEKNDLAFALSYLFKNCFQTFLKLTTIFRTCNQCSHVQCKNFLIFQAFRDITCDDSLCQTFNGCCLTNTRFTDQNRIILGLTWKNTDDVSNLCITTDDRIKFLISCFLHKILAVFIQCVIGCLRIVTDNSLVASDSRQRLQKSFSGNAKFIEDLLHTRAWLCQQWQKQMLNRNIFVSHCFCFIFRIYQWFVQILPKSQITAGYFDFCIQCFLHYIDKIFFINIHLLNQFENQAVFLCQQSI